MAENQANQSGSSRESGRHSIKSIGGYELLARLGRGGMGAVYKARQRSMDREVALKILPPKLARDPTFVERFLREARAAGKLSHPNIVAGIDVGEADGFHYFAMEYVEGETLTALMKREGKLPEDRVLKVSIQIARGLGHAHAHGLVHRDVKPQNVLLPGDGTAKLCDLGLARSTETDQGLTIEGTSLGTPHYISPEQVEGRKDIDGRTDLYALGATMYHMLAGRPPFTGPTAAKVMTMHLTERPAPLGDLAPEVSAETSAVVMRLLEKEPGARYGSAEEVVQDLELIGAKQAPMHLAGALERRRTTVRTRPVSRRLAAAGSEPEAGRRSRLVLALAGGAGLLVVLVVALALALGGGSSGPSEEEKAEEAARQEWAEEVRPLEKERLSAGEAKALLAALAGFERRHGSTAYGESRAERAEALRARAEAAQKGGEPAPPAADKAEKELAELFAYAKRWEKENAGSYRDAIKRYREVEARARALKKPLWGLKATDEAARVEKERGAAAAAAYKAIEARVRALVEKRDYDGAVAACVAPAGELAPLVEPRVKGLAAEVTRSAEEAYEGAVSAAKASLGAGKPEEGLAVLKALAGSRYEARAREVEELAGRLEKAAADAAAREAEQRLAVALEAFDRALGAFEEAVAEGVGQEEGEFAKAREVASRAARDGSLKAVADLVRSLGEVAEALPLSRRAELEARARLKGQEVRFTPEGGREQTGTVEEVKKDKLTVRVSYRIGGQEMSSTYDIPYAILSEEDARKLKEAWVPRSAAERVAAAAMAVAAEDVARAEALLAGAEGHPLAARYARRLRVLRIGAAEASAEEAWKALARAVPEKIDKAAAEKLKGLLAAFEAAHAATKFAQAKAAEIEALKTRLAVALEAKSYAGVWTRRTPKILGVDGRPGTLPKRFGHCGGAIYDSKRKLCVLYGAGAYDWKRNYIWAYDPGKDTWTCLLENDQKADGVTRPKPFFAGGGTSLATCYDPARDLYWVYADKSLWAYSPEAKRWRKGPDHASREGIAIAYWPADKALALLSVPTGVLDPESGKMRAQAKEGTPFRFLYSWRPGSCCSGTFGQALGNGVFLVFGCDTDDTTKRHTCAFDPSKPAWQTLAPKQSPPGRFKPGLVFCEHLKVWVLFGGAKGDQTPTGTWVYAPHLGTWLQVATKESPPRGGPMWYDAAHDQIVLLTRGQTWTLKLKPSYEGAAAPASPPAPADAAAVQKLFKGRVESFDPKTLRARLVWDFADEGQLQDFEKGRAMHFRYGRGQLQMVCSGPECDTLRIPGLSATDARVRLTYATTKDLWGTNYLGAWFGAPAEGKRSAFALFSGTKGSALANRGPIGYEKRLRHVPGKLPTKGTIEFGCRDGRTWIAFGENRVLEADAPAGEPGAGVAVGGGFGLSYNLERLEAEGVLDRAWLQERLRVLKGGSLAPSAGATAVQKHFKGRVASYDPKTRRATAEWDFTDRGQLEDFGVLRASCARAERGRLGVICSGGCDDLLRLPQFEGRDVSVHLEYRGLKGRDVAFLGVWFGPRTEGGERGPIGFLADRSGLGFGTRTKLQGFRRMFKQAPRPLPDHGTLEVACTGGRVRASVDGAPVLESEIPALPEAIGAGVAIGGGNDLRYEITRLVVTGALDRAWLQEQLRGAGRRAP